MLDGFNHDKWINDMLDMGHRLVVLIISIVIFRLTGSVIMRRKMVPK